MRVVDTSAWIEVLNGTELGSNLSAALPEREEWVVPTIVKLELSKWLEREVDAKRANQVIGFTRTCLIADMNTAIALAAANLCTRHRLATADAVIYATALAYDADLLTCDRHFENLPGVRFMSKQVP